MKLFDQFFFTLIKSKYFDWRARLNLALRRKTIEKDLANLNIQRNEDGTYKAHAAWEQTPGTMMLAQDIGRYFALNKGINFVEMNMYDPATMERYVLIVQLFGKGKKSPAEIIGDLRDGLRQIVRELPESRGARIALETLKRQGYDMEVP